MHRHHLNELLKAALEHEGCESSMLRGLDCHGSVELVLRDYPPICFDIENDRPIIWSNLCEFYQDRINFHSKELLKVLISHCPCSASEHFILRENAGHLQLYLAVADEYLETAENLGVAINAFFESQSGLFKAIQ